jgi:FkbM family methyltransferase
MYLSIIMNIFYGTPEKHINVNNICITNLVKDNIITIPNEDDNRANIFTDPHYGVKKYIFITDDNGTLLHTFDDNIMLRIDIEHNTMRCVLFDDIGIKLDKIRSSLKIQYGSLYDELSEQRMAITYLTGNEKVLELGGNIGRNSLVIASILGQQNSNNLVTLECDKDIANQLRENRDANHLKFHVESSALSKRKLIQKGWDTIESDVVLEGYLSVDTITLDELNAKYNILFDTLVLDCEGAFYYILKDMPEILNNITLIIMENDYHDISHKEYVDSVLKEHNFFVDYKESGEWGPCESNFFEVWKKTT